MSVALIASVVEEGSVIVILIVDLADRAMSLVIDCLSEQTLSLVRRTLTPTERERERTPLVE